MKDYLVIYYKNKGESLKVEARLSIKMFSTQAAGIGDHTTGDLYKNLDEIQDTYQRGVDMIEFSQKLQNGHL